MVTFHQGGRSGGGVSGVGGGSRELLSRQVSRLSPAAHPVLGWQYLKPLTLLCKPMWPQSSLHANIYHLSCPP